MDIVIAIGAFISTMILIEGGYFVFKTIQNPELKRVRMRLRRLPSAVYENKDINIMRKSSLSDVPWLNRVLLRIPSMHKIYRLMKQADIRYPLGFFVLLSILLTFGGFFGGSLITKDYLMAIPGAVLLGMVPFFYIYSKKKRRMQKFFRQLPDALELVARSLKAGHAFSGGLKVVADEFDDPIGTEFDNTMAEINFGVDVNEALKNLSNRVDCPDIKFFVISVILQRETGGNLAEILENIAHLIRERFKLQGRIRILSAQGKLTGTILVILPFVLAFLINLINPRYIKVLFTDPIGKIMVVFALFLMVMGIFAIKRIIAIRV